MKEKCVLLIFAAAAMAGFVISACSDDSPPVTKSNVNQVYDQNGYPIAWDGAVFMLTSSAPGDITAIQAGANIGTITGGRIELKAVPVFAAYNVSSGDSIKLSNNGQLFSLNSAGNSPNTKFYTGSLFVAKTGVTSSTAPLYLERNYRANTDKMVNIYYFDGSAVIVSAGAAYDVDIQVGAAGWQALASTVENGKNTHRLVTSKTSELQWQIIN